MKRLIKYYDKDPEKALEFFNREIDKERNVSLFINLLI